MTADVSRLAQAGPDPESGTVLRTVDLAVGYRSRGVRRAVLEHVNLSVKPGELVCLLGPNGIGKSTLIRTLARMQPALWGSIELAGTEIRAMSAGNLARLVGVVLTERIVVEALSVRRIVELGRYPYSGWFGGLTDADHAVVDWAINAVGARHLANRDVSQLSDGERQRVMVARALAQQPILLVLDEPTAFLDVPSRVELMALLRQLTRSGKLAVVVSTHDLELALRSADTVWLLMPGGELRCGAPEDVIVSGGIARAFEGRHVRFHGEERSFRWLTGDSGRAAVRGYGIHAAMAKSVLEREGFAVEAETAADGVPIVVASESGWRWSQNGTEASGKDFASLAAWLRRRSRVS